jgi:hypothetical protein
MPATTDFLVGLACFPAGLYSLPSSTAVAASAARMVHVPHSLKQQQHNERQRYPVYLLVGHNIKWESGIRSHRMPFGSLAATNNMYDKACISLFVRGRLLHISFMFFLSL